jgi:hypothetical protein
MPKVSLVKGNNRRENIKRSLELISEGIRKNFGPRQVIIKPNFVSTGNQSDKCKYFPHCELDLTGFGCIRWRYRHERRWPDTWR